uniref:Protein FAM136A n=1 Tax=Rhinolophus ferrumequinum TaxID=59479 RepID=A0A671E2N8_RHIFE
MAELQQLRVQEAVDSTVKSLERENIRKRQGLMLRCSARCCEDSQATMQQVLQCPERCSAPLAQAPALGASGLEKFQDRLPGAPRIATTQPKIQ